MQVPLRPGFQQERVLKWSKQSRVSAFEKRNHVQSDIAWRENVARFVGGTGGTPLGEEGETQGRPRSPGDWPWSAAGASLRGSPLALGSPPGSPEPTPGTTSLNSAFSPGRGHRSLEHDARAQSQVGSERLDIDRQGALEDSRPADSEEKESRAYPRS